MKVLHTGTLNVTAGGPAMSTYLTLKGLIGQGVKAEIVMYELNHGEELRGNDIPIHYVHKAMEQKFQYSPSYKKELLQCGDFDIYHAQGIWQYPTYALASVARKLNKPYLITPRGMLYPQDIVKSNRWMKRLSLKIRLLNDLNKAACVQTTCTNEMQHCRNLGVTSPISIIPNPIEIKNYNVQKNDNVFRLGYLGRLSPRKNVESLLYAWHNLGSEVKNAELLIIGGGDDNYERFLKEKTAELNLTNVRFVGFLSGKEKDEAIASLSVLAMPSEFENLGNVMLEGLVRGIPCIATKGSPWEELNTHHCGWWMDFSQTAITQAVKEALHTPDKELLKMGENGRQLMKNNYSVETVAAQMIQLYNWIIGKGEKPDFVYL